MKGAKLVLESVEFIRDVENINVSGNLEIFLIPGGYYSYPSFFFLFSSIINKIVNYSILKFFFLQSHSSYLQSFTGLFDLASGSEFVGKEIVKCIDLAKDGIHAIIVVFSVRTRFTEEEETALRSLQTLFGNKILDYMIVVFTGGDELEENNESIEQYLGHGECPRTLKVFL